MGASPPVVKAFLCPSLFYSHRDENKMDLCACASARAQIARTLWTNLPICLSVFIRVEEKKRPSLVTAAHHCWYKFTLVRHVEANTEVNQLSE